MRSDIIVRRIFLLATFIIIMTDISHILHNVPRYPHDVCLLWQSARKFNNHWLSSAGGDVRIPLSFLNHIFLDKITPRDVTTPILLLVVVLIGQQCSGMKIIQGFAVEIFADVFSKVRELKLPTETLKPGDNDTF